MEPILTKHWNVPDLRNIDVALKTGAYEVAREVVGKREPSSITDEVKKSGLRGRGGAGFPTGLKWSFLPKDSPKPKYLVINADESEPGSYKDRAILEIDPHQLLEGCILTCYAIGSHACYIYIRGEYWSQANILNQAIAEAYAKGFLGAKPFGVDYAIDITVHRGAGAYICGEETALLTSLEGNRGYPRLKPPFPATHGLWASPTVVNNVETIANVPWIVRHGGEAYSKYGKYVLNDEGKPVVDSRGTRLMCPSGDIHRAGVHEIELGIKVTDYLEEYCGGVKGTMKALIPGGSSCPVLTAEEVQTAEMTYESMAKLGTMFGTGGMIVLNETRNLVWTLHNLLRFYAHESCGQCTPCREGTDWLYKILSRMLAGKGSDADLQEVLDIADNMENRTICALAAAATMPTRSYITKFKPEFVAHFRKGGIPTDLSGRYLQPLSQYLPAEAATV